MKTLLRYLSIFLLTGCASTYRQGGTESIDAANMAIIDTSSCGAQACPIVQEIDGKWRGIGNFKRYELAPGKRVLRLIFMNSGVAASKAILLEFDALPGHTYSLKANANFATMTWSPVIFDTLDLRNVSNQIGATWAY